MNNISKLVKQCLYEYGQLLSHHKALQPALPQKTILGLFLFSLTLLTIATLGYFTNGYHFGFLEMNAYSQYIPPFFLHNLTMFGDGVFILTLILALTTQNIQFHWTVLLAALIGCISTNLLKLYFDAPRPPAVLDHDTFIIVGKALIRYSFPSGHTLASFLLANVAICYVQSIYAKTALLLLAVGVGLSRILLGVHWPLDTLVGGALGIWCSILAVWLSYKWRAGINPGPHIFILFLFTAACLSIFFEGVDYAHAKPMAYTVALIAVTKLVYLYVLKPIFNSETVSITSTLGKFIAEKPGTTFVIFTLLLLVYRIAVFTQGHFQVFYDEAYYYHWSLNPDFGYYSKPPMVAWVLSIGTFFFGPTTFAIKIISPFLYAGTGLIIFSIANSYASGRTGLLAGILFSCSLLVGFNSEFITTDAPLLFFWALSWYLFLNAIMTNHFHSWLALGLTTGLGMLSKYTMGALPLALFGFLMLSNHYRPLLYTKGPWIAAVLAGLIFSLNIYWNFQHDFIALQHTKEISQTDGALFNFPSLFGFLITQLLIFGPISSYLFIQAVFNRPILLSYKNLANEKLAYKKLTDINPENKKAIPLNELFRCALLVTGVILFAISMQAFLSRAFANWAAPWLIGASIVTALYLEKLPSQNWLKLLKIGIYSQLIILSLFYHWPQVLTFSQIEAGKTTTPFARVSGWKELADQLNPILDQHSSAYLLSESRDLLAYLGFYSTPGSFALARWNPEKDNVRDYYDLKLNLRNWSGDKNQDFIFVSREILEEKTLSSFNKHRFLGELYATPFHNVKRRAYVYHVTGFIGYSDE